MSFVVAFLRSLRIESIFSKAHCVNALMCGMSDRVRSVRAYSTRGGTSG